MTDYKKLAEVIWPDKKFRLAASLLGESPYSRQIISDLFDGMDIDTADYFLLVLLSCIGIRNKWQYFPPDSIPRLQGLIKYNKARNIFLLKDVSETYSDLEKAGISSVLSGDLAASFYYKNILCNKISSAFLVTKTESSRLKDRKVIVANGLFYGSSYGRAMLFENSKEVTIARRIVKIVSEEDAAISVLLQYYYGMTGGLSIYESSLCLISFSYLAKRIEWERMLHRSELLGRKKEIMVALGFADALAPGTVPASFAGADSVDTKWLERRFMTPGKNYFSKILYFIPDQLRRKHSLECLGIRTKCIPIFLFNQLKRSIRSNISVPEVWKRQNCNDNQ